MKLPFGKNFKHYSIVLKKLKYLGTTLKNETIYNRSFINHKKLTYFSKKSE